MPSTPLSPKHKRFIPYTLLGDNRTMRFGDKACSKGAQCKKARFGTYFHISFQKLQSAATLF